MKYDWKIIQNELIFRNPWIELYQDKVKTRTGKVLDYTWYKSSDVAVVVPFIHRNNLVMIRQYRYPLRKVLLEFPAGHIEDGEDAAKTAIRELLEETGYIAKKIDYMYTYHPSVSKSSQLVYIFRASDLVEEKSNHEGGEEIIRTEIISVRELKNMIKQRRIDSAGTLLAYLICCSGILDAE
jgi:ADP-ribose pyrophosphatase